MRENEADVIIVGGGQAGATATITLRQLGYAGSVLILDAGAEPPYERPPLSKEYIAGQRSFERCLIRPPGFWAEQRISLLHSARTVAVDAAARQITLADGRSLGFSKLVWAAGGTPRRLLCPGADLGGVFTLHDKPDADAIIARLPRVQRAVVIGGGYIGLEVAAALVKQGRQVTVLEAQDRVLARVAGEALSRFIAAEHRAHGVDLHLGAQVAEILGTDGEVTGARLADGSIIPADLVIVGIGIVPQAEPLLTAGAAGGNGVDVNEFCETSLPGIYAAGDCARHRNHYANNAWVRLESVQNATDQAITVAHAIAGQTKPYTALPWFWSNQYDLRLQSAGLSAGHDETIIRGDMTQRSFSILYLRQGQVIALDCVNCTKDFVSGKALVASGARIAPVLLQDTAQPLKALLPA